jgi:hypothetical protein
MQRLVATTTHVPRAQCTRQARAARASAGGATSGSSRAKWARRG